MTDRIGFLLDRAQKAVAAEYADKNKNGVSLVQLSVLAALSLLGPQSQTELSVASHIHRSSLSELLARMATDTLIVSVEKEGQSARAKFVTITPHGRQAMERGVKALTRAESVVMKRIPLAKRDSLRDALRAIAFSRREKGKTK